MESYHARARDLVQDGKDIVAVRGYIVSDAPDEIVVNIDIEMGGYLFE